MEPLAGLIQFREKLAQAKSLTLSASSHLENHEPDAALADLASAIGFWKSNPAVYYLQGLAFEQKGDLPQARSSLEKAVELKPDYPEALISLGRILWELGDTRGALKEFDDAVAVAPDFAEAHYNRGLAEARLGQIKPAIREYREALALKADYFDARLNFGLALIQAQDLGLERRSRCTPIARRPIIIWGWPC